MKRVIILFSALLLAAMVQAQDFIEKAAIEFEVKTNIKKTMGDGTWAEMMKENLPPFKVFYCDYIFAGDKSIYKFNRFEENSKLPDFMRKDDEENQWYSDFSKNETVFKKNMFGSPFLIKDSLPQLQWRLTNENRIIAGFNCRKAFTKIFDSVYVFAFYTDEITISGGPCGISGLPGMILGVTIPRLYTSWLATKVSITKVDAALIKPIDAKKTMSRKEFRDMLVEKSKDWSSGDSDEDKKMIQQFLWSAML